MTLLDLLAAGVPTTLLVNWPVFAVCAYVAHRHPGSRTLIDRRWVSLAIALGSTALTMVVIAYFGHVSLGRDMTAVLLALPVYALTCVNAIFLWLTARGKW